MAEGKWTLIRKVNSGTNASFTFATLKEAKDFMSSINPMSVDEYNGNEQAFVTYLEGTGFYLIRPSLPIDPRESGPLTWMLIPRQGDPFAPLFFHSEKDCVAWVIQEAKRQDVYNLISELIPDPAKMAHIIGYTMTEVTPLYWACRAIAILSDNVKPGYMSALVEGLSDYLSNDGSTDGLLDAFAKFGSLRVPEKGE